jgi:hypothetical protein
VALLTVYTLGENTENPELVVACGSRKSGFSSVMRVAIKHAKRPRSSLSAASVLSFYRLLTTSAHWLLHNPTNTPSGPGNHFDVAYTTEYFWVVICNNRRFHHKGNTSQQHQIPLGETDAFSLPPMLTENVKVCCNVCHQEYWYSPKEVLRPEIEVPEHFTAHPLFR